MNEVLTRIARKLDQSVWLGLVGAGGKFWWMNGVEFGYSSLHDSYQLEGKDR